MERRKNYHLNHLDCPHCAAKIEKTVGRLEGIRAANVDLPRQKLLIELEDGFAADEITERLSDAVKSVDECVSLADPEQARDTAEDEGGVAGEIAWIAAGAAVYACGFIANLLHAPGMLTIAVFLLALLLTGGEIFLKAVRNIGRREIFDENLLMSIASLGAFAIGLYAEGVAVMLFSRIGEFLQELAARRSRRSIAELMNLRPETANLKTEEGVRKVSPDEVAVGERIEVRPGERIPLDGTVISGSSYLDTSDLTGESAPRSAAPGDTVTGGFVNGEGLLVIRVEKAYGESTVAKIIDLVENAGSKKAKAENFITKFARIYTPAVTVAALLIAVLPPLLLHAAFTPWITRALVFLVVSCPCALVVSVPLGFFAGIGAASYNGILIKGGNYLEMLSRAELVVFDKTGTLTEGRFEVAEVLPADPSIPAEHVLETAALAESASGHPIARSILSAYGRKADVPEGADYNQFPGLGVIVRTQGGLLAAGNAKLMEREQIAFTAPERSGTVVHVAENGRYIGSVVIADRVKPDAEQAISGLRGLNVRRTALLTGDSEAAAREVTEKLGLNEVRAGLLPNEKVEAFEQLTRGVAGASVFVGDGVNDAPVLARADVGIAMGGTGSDAAVEAADLVIMNDQPSKIVTAVRIAKYVHRIVWQNIVFALLIKFLILLLDMLGYSSIWAAVFADTGVALLAVLNSLRILLRRKKFAEAKSSASGVAN